MYNQIDSSIYITKMCLFVRIGDISFNLIRRKDYVPDNPVVFILSEKIPYVTANMLINR